MSYISLTIKIYPNPCSLVQWLSTLLLPPYATRVKTWLSVTSLIILMTPLGELLNTTWNNHIHFLSLASSSLLLWMKYSKMLPLEGIKRCRDREDHTTLELWEKLHFILCCYNMEQRIIITQFVILTNKHIRNVLYTCFSSLEYINGQHKHKWSGTDACHSIWGIP